MIGAVLIITNYGVLKMFHVVSYTGSTNPQSPLHETVRGEGFKDRSTASRYARHCAVHWDGNPTFANMKELPCGGFEVRKGPNIVAVYLVKRTDDTVIEDIRAKKTKKELLARRMRKLRIKHKYSKMRRV